MSDSQKPREFWIEDNKLFPKRAYHVPCGDERNSFLNKHNNWVWVIDKSAYDQLMQQALAMRKALASLKEDSKNYFDLVGDSINLSNPYSHGRYDVFKWADEQTTKALEQFDEFMKRTGEK